MNHITSHHSATTGGQPPLNRCPWLRLALLGWVCLALGTAPALRAESAEYEYTIIIGKPVTEVWAALTTKATIDQYYMVPVLTLDLQKDGKLAYGKDAPLIEGVFTEVTAPARLGHTFKFTGASDVETQVIYELTPLGDSLCSLHLIHTGFQAETQFFADVTQGWPVILSSLKTVLETGKPLPKPKPQPEPAPATDSDSATDAAAAPEGAAVPKP